MSAIKSWQKRQKEEGTLESKPLERGSRKIEPEKLRADVAEYPYDFNSERAVRFGCSEDGMRKAMKRCKLTRKKRQ